MNIGNIVLYKLGKFDYMTKIKRTTLQKARGVVD